MGVDSRMVAALRRLNPGEPADAHDYIARDETVLERGWNALERAETVLLAGQTLCALMHGCTGVGKTTEFGRWVQALAPIAEVVQVRLVNAQPWDVHETIARRLAVVLPGRVR